MKENVLTQFNRHRAPVTGVAVIKNSNLVVTSGYDGAVALFDTSSGESILLGYHDHLVNSIFTNKTGTLAASCSADYTVAIWDLETKKRILTLEGHSDDVEAFVFISGKIGASVSRDCTIIIWDMLNGREINKLIGHEKDVLSVQFYNNTLYSTGDDMTVRAWNIETGELLKMWGPFENETDTCAIDVERGRLVLGCDDGIVRIFDLDSGEPLGEINAHTSAIKKVSVEPNNGNILSAAYDQKIAIWDAQTFECMRVLDPCVSKWERSFTWSYDGKFVYAGTFDGTVVVWNAEDGKLLKEIGCTNVVGNACFNDLSVVDSVVLSASDDGVIRVFERTNEKLSVVLEEQAEERVLMNACALAPNQKIAVLGTHNQNALIVKLDGSNLSEESKLFLGEGPINSVRITKDSSLAFIAAYSGKVVAISLNDYSFKSLPVHGNAVKAVDLHPNMDLGVSCCAGGEIFKWDFDGKLLGEFEAHDSIVNDLAISHDGKYLASVGRDFALNIYDFEKLTKIKSILLGNKSLKSVCFNHEGNLAVGDYWGTVYMVNGKDFTYTSAQIARNGISAMSASHEDKIIAVSYDGSISIFNGELEILSKEKIMEQRLHQLEEELL